MLSEKLVPHGLPALVRHPRVALGADVGVEAGDLPPPVQQLQVHAAILPAPPTAPVTVLGARAARVQRRAGTEMGAG